MLIECGPSHDRRTLNFSLPFEPKFYSDKTRKLWLRINGLKEGNKIGCFVSGGADSALLYYLLIEENINTGNQFEIIPYTILRIGAREPAQNTIDWVHDNYHMPRIPLNVVGDPNLEEIHQVESGVKDVLGITVDYLYLGIIDDRPEHYVNWFKAKFNETVQRKYPFLNLEKSHIIDLYHQKNLFDLLKVTTSCNTGSIPACGTCNGCEARSWAFQELGLPTL
jgi:hypothetical protein